MTDNEDDFDDDLTQADGPDDVDTDALARASADAEQVGDDPDIDSPPTPGGSQLPDHTGAPMPDMPSTADILDGVAPVFLAHKSHNFAQRVPEALGVARKVTAGRIGLGVVIRLPRMSPTGAQAYLTSCQHAALRIADPEVFTIAGTGSPADPPPVKQISYYPWAGAVPDVNDPQPVKDSWIGEVLDAQLAAGANVLLSPTGWVPAAQAQQSLAEAMSWVTHTRNVLGADTPMFVNLTLAREWLTDRALRAMLLHELVESTEPLWYVRVRWPIVEPSYGQLIEPELLNGYRELSTTAALEGKVLILPNSGLTGWFSTALGASGFSTGMSWPEQAFAEQRIVRSRPGQPRPPAAERYFDRTALHPLLWTQSTALAGVPGHLTCQCRYCVAMRTGGFDKERSGAHYLVRAARLLDELGDKNRRLEALRIVRRAQGFVTTLAGTANALPSKWTPTHLGAWESRLR